MAFLRDMTYIVLKVPLNSNQPITTGISNTATGCSAEGVDGGVKLQQMMPLSTGSEKLRQLSNFVHAISY